MFKMMAECESRRKNNAKVFKGVDKFDFLRVNGQFVELRKPPSFSELDNFCFANVYPQRVSTAIFSDVVETILNCL